MRERATDVGSMRTLTEPRALLGVGLALLAMAACGSEEAPGSNEPAPGSNAADADVRGTPDGGQSDGAIPTPGLDASVDAASDAEVDADASARDLSTDPKNCGAVGRDCLGGVCQAGVCQPTVVRTDLSTYALGASDVYVGTTWTSQAGRIVAVPKDGTAEKLLAANFQAVGVVTDGRFVYWATGGTNAGFSLSLERPALLVLRKHPVLRRIVMATPAALGLAVEHQLAVRAHHNPALTAETRPPRSRPVPDLLGDLLEPSSEQRDVGAGFGNAHDD